MRLVKPSIKTLLHSLSRQSGGTGEVPMEIESGFFEAWAYQSQPDKIRDYLLGGKTGPYAAGSPLLGGAECYNHCFLATGAVAWLICFNCLWLRRWWLGHTELPIGYFGLTMPGVSVKPCHFERSSKVG